MTIFDNNILIKMDKQNSDITHALAHGDDHGVKKRKYGMHG